MKHPQGSISSVCVAGAAVLIVGVWGVPASASRRVNVSGSGPPRGASAHEVKANVPTRASVRYIVKRGDTLTSVLRANGLRGRDLSRWQVAALRTATPIRLVPDHVITLEFDTPHRLARLGYDADDERRLVIERSGARVRSHTESLPVTVTAVGAQGVVDKSFQVSARGAGIPERVVAQMVKVLGPQFDFRRTRSGDKFEVIYERRVSAAGRILSPGKVLAAEIGNGRRTAQAFYYHDGSEAMYVDAGGQAPAQGLLRYPVEFKRISSGFSRSRLHPILKQQRPHLGVDFEAPPGTPVHAAADGVVTLAGWNGDNGNEIEIEHHAGLATAYAHLRGIARGVRPGAGVRQGQVIGWTGRTGLATGPHLHFALSRNGQYVNPLTAKVTLQRRVSDPRRFQALKQDMLQRFANIAAPAPVEPIMLAALPVSHRLGIVTITQ